MAQEYIDNDGDQIPDKVYTYLAGPRGIECRIDDTATTDKFRWYVLDGLGSVIREVDGDGNITATRTYDVFGAIRSSSGSASTNHKFVGSLGHTDEDSTGLIYMRARYYDPVIGRFISEDPGRNGRNWYVYCENNPINRVDETGKFSAAVDAFLFTIGLIINPPFTELVIAATMAVVAVGAFVEGVYLYPLTQNVLGGSLIVANSALEMFKGLAVKMTQANGVLTIAINASGASAVIFNLIGIVADALAAGDIINRALNGE